jgi:uncharacterized protein with ParB-like and HNH nuclease domain
MPDPALFGHDRLAHLLSDRLLGVPHFQRGYAWELENVQEFLDDLRIAREENQPTLWAPSFLQKTRMIQAGK